MVLSVTANVTLRHDTVVQWKERLYGKGLELGLNWNWEWVVWRWKWYWGLQHVSMYAMKPWHSERNGCSVRGWSWVWIEIDSKWCVDGNGIERYSKCLSTTWHSGTVKERLYGKGLELGLNWNWQQVASRWKWYWALQQMSLYGMIQWHCERNGCTVGA